MTNTSLIAAVVEGRKITRAELERLERRFFKVRQETQILTEALARCYIECDGPAHRLGGKEHCGRCMPRWGRVPNPEQVRG